ncbi:hypothetical protein HYW43_03175 [Candidatus Daviesbacteria bacterium]|nr:hypothetical protein [Candidatus Daviesbacteria bacterium]
MVKVLIGLVGLGVVVFLILAVEYSVFNDVHVNAIKRATGQPVEEKKPVAENKGEKCKSDSNPVFKGQFIDRANILFIRPLGDTQARFIARSSIVLKEGTEAAVYNPTDAVLEEVSEKDGKYKLSLQASCEVGFFFDRLDKVAKELQPKALIKKGELLGYVKGVAQGDSFDFFVSNTSKKVSHINSKRWQDKESLYAQCPYEYFDVRNANNLKRDYIAYTLVHNENTIQKEWNKEQGVSTISCGNLSYDIKGTASGGWFKGESTDTKGDYLSINKYLSTVQISIRKDGKLVEVLTDYSPDVLLPDLKSGKVACYQDVNQDKWVIVKLISDNKLSIAKGNGGCPTQFAQEVSDIWER